MLVLALRGRLPPAAMRATSFLPQPPVSYSKACVPAPRRFHPVPNFVRPCLVPLVSPPRDPVCVVAAEHITECRKNQTALVFDESVRYRYDTFHNNVYPRKMYGEMRNFIGRMHNSTFDQVMRRPDSSWAIPGDGGSCSFADRQLLLPDSEFMGAFLWCVKKILCSNVENAARLSSRIRHDCILDFFFCRRLTRKSYATRVMIEP